MPPDTIYIPGQTGPPPPAGNYFTDSVVQQYWQEDSPASKKKGPHYIFPEWQMFLFVFVVVFASAYFYIIRPDIANRRRKRKLYIGKEEGKLLIEIKYDNWLNKYNPYYHSLNGDLKKRFLHRVQHYLVAKEFHYHAMQEEEYIPVLISGAAVQLTFGLKNYLMDYFDTIHVIKTQYELKNHEMYDGHVSRNGIYISWNNFMRGYDDYADCRNVGLHEMAHAISTMFSLVSRIIMIKSLKSD